jgi:sortase A
LTVAQTAVPAPEQLARLRTGISVVEHELSGRGPYHPFNAGDRRRLVRHLLSLEEAMDEAERWAPDDPAVVELREHLDALGARVAGVLAGTRSRPATIVRLRTDRASPQSTLRPVLAAASRGLIALGVLLVLFIGYELGLSSFPHDRAQNALLGGFKGAIPTTVLGAADTVPDDGSPVALLHIQGLGVDQVVIEGTTTADLESGPGHLRASVLPGEYGNAVILGRRTTYGAPFGSLAQLHAGDAITVTTGQGVFKYTVTKIERTSADDGSPFVQTADSRLTLVTSDPGYLPSERLVVIAILQGKPDAVATRALLPDSAGELGLAYDPSALVVAAFWAELFVAVIIALPYVRRRWPATITYLFAAPVLLALTLLMFSSLDLALPGTL